MATTLDQIKDILTDLKTDQRDTNGALRTLIQESTSAITRVDVYLNRPFYKNSTFWVGLSQVSLLVLFGAMALYGNKCLIIKDTIQIGCEEHAQVDSISPALSE